MPPRAPPPDPERKPAAQPRRALGAGRSAAGADAWLATPIPHDHPPKPAWAVQAAARAEAPVKRRRKWRVPYFGRSREGLSRKEQRFRLLRDVLGGLFIVAVVVAALYIASDGAWPPVLAVESGSMMHDLDDTGYGRLGTIDVGDLVLVERLTDPRKQIRTWADGGGDQFGRPGDVIVYAPNADQAARGTSGGNVSIIHRAMAYVEVSHGRNGSSSYRVHWIDGQILSFGNEGIYLPELGFSETYGYSPTDGYAPRYSGFITKGDNSITNPASDQAVNISGLVEPSWIHGRVYGEIPWMGLARLATQSGQTNYQVPGWTRVGNAFAPLELWTCFFLVIGLVVIIPLTYDTTRMYLRYRRAVRERRAEEEEMRRRAQDRVEFEVLG